MRTHRLILTCCALAAALAMPSSASAGVFHVGCGFVKFEQTDPIFSFGAPSHHLHVFKGNKTISATSTHATLRAATETETTCFRNVDKDKPGSGNLSSYWAPALVKHNLDGTQTPIPIFNNATYYSSQHHDPSKVEPFPPGLKLLAGNPNATGPQERVRWECGPEGSLIRYEGGGLYCLDVNPSNSVRPGLTLRAFFPSCWDGTPPSDADTTPGQPSYDDTPHVRDAVWQSGTGWVCPAGFDRPIPMVHLIIGFQTQGGADVHISSHNEWGEHADFFEAWDPEVMKKLVENCIQVEGANCGANDTP